jgi:hypothetical protein
VKMRTPSFEPELVEGGLRDGYWLQPVDVDGDGVPDLVASGLAEGEVVWYQNPGWTRRRIARFDKTVSLTTGDVTGSGRTDLVVCHDYGHCMFDCGPNDGRISWLRNPGSPDAGDWEVRPVGDLVATHRMRLGSFTGRSAVELLALPVVGPCGGADAVHQPIRVTLFSRPADVLNAGCWDAQVVDEATFRVIHGVAMEREGGDRDRLLLASEEGISWFGCGADGRWRSESLGAGEVGQQPRTGFKGSGNVAAGRVGGDRHAYVAAVEPFHGNTVAVYTREPGAGPADGRWRRTVLDVFGDPNERGEGAAHHVVAADFDGDGDDEFLVALRGPMPWQGVFYYKAIDVAQALFVKVRVSTPSAARIAVADFDGDGRLDFATTGYYTPGYFLCDDPQVVVFHNRFGAPIPGQPAIPSGPLGG